MSKSSNPPIFWVDTSEHFSTLAEQWCSAPYLAIDTEFERRTTYYPILALVQVFDSKAIYLIDPLKVSCPEAFKTLCANPELTKIMHSAREDLEVFFTAWQCQFNGLFDTQVAYAFLTGEISKGYSALVEEICTTRLSKEQTQSDWLKRPLADVQLDYAANDVKYLPELYHYLTQKMANQPYEHLYHQEVSELCSIILKQSDYELDYRLASNVSQLNGEQIALFKHLYQWREQLAIQQNKTRNHIIKDHQLVQVALLRPKRKEDFYSIKDLHPRSIRVYAPLLIDEVAAFEAATNKPLKPVADHRDVPDLKGLVKALEVEVKYQAERLGIAASLLLSQKSLRKIAFAYLTQEEPPAIWSGWRQQLLEEKFNPAFCRFSPQVSSNLC